MGAHLELRVALVTRERGRVVQEHQWSVVYDTIPPVIGSYRAVVFADGTVGVEVLADDEHSEVRRRGVATRYSTDDGLTWETAVHEYTLNDFDRPTTFQAILPPLPRGTRLQLQVAVFDMAGNAQNVIPRDATIALLPWLARGTFDDQGPRIGEVSVFSVETLLRATSERDRIEGRAIGSLAQVEDALVRVEATRASLRRRRDQDINEELNRVIPFASGRDSARFQSAQFLEGARSTIEVRVPW